MPYTIPDILYPYEKRWIRGALNRKKELKVKQPEDGISAYIWSGLTRVNPDKDLLPEGTPLKRRSHLDVLINRMKSNSGERNDTL